MDYLLDTHLLLWALADSEKLPKKAFEILMNPKNQIYYSVASMWEVSINSVPEKFNFFFSFFIETSHIEATL